MSGSGLDLSDPRFRIWLINRAKNMTGAQMVLDDYFVCRLAESIQKGRSTRFNQQEKEGGRNSALLVLKEEYKQENELGG